MNGYPPRASIVVCTAPRSGSTLLCAALEETNLGGRPREYFTEDVDRLRRTQIEVSASDPSVYLEQLVRATATPNGVFSTKLFAYQLEIFDEFVRSAAGEGPTGEAGGPLSAHLRRRLGNIGFVWLKRRNKYAQAVSYLRASVTGHWTAPMAGEAGETTEFDCVRLDRICRMLNAMDRRWEVFFRNQGVSPLVLTYEDFGQDLGGEAGRILDYCGIDRPARLTCPPRFRRQADDLSRAWESRLRAQSEAQKPAPQGCVCLICDTPGADLAVFVKALNSTGRLGGAVVRFDAPALEPRLSGRPHAHYDVAAALVGRLSQPVPPDEVICIGLSAGHVPVLRRICAVAFRALKVASLPLSAVLGAWDLRPRRIMLRWRDPQLQAAAIYRRRYHREGATTVDQAAFSHCLSVVALAEKAWAEALADEDMETLEVFQEDLERAPSRVLRAVLAFCTGVDDDFADGEALRKDLGPEREILELRRSAPGEAPARSCDVAEALPREFD